MSAVLAQEGKKLKLSVGEEVLCEDPTRYFSPGDFKNFCVLTRDQNAFHWDQQAAESFGASRPVAPGMFVASLAVGVLTSYLPPNVQLRGFDTLVFLEKMDQLTPFAISYRVVAVKMKLAIIEFSVVGREPLWGRTFVQGRLRIVLP